MGAKARRRHGPIEQRRVPRISDVGFIRMARSACSQCGSTALEWATLGSLPDGVPDEVRGYAAELRPMLGVSASFWWCTSCGEAGAFEQEVHRN